MTTRLLPLALLATFIGCGDDVLSPGDLPADLQPPDVALTSWERVVRDGFSFALPPGFVKEEGVPIDSDAAHYSGEDAGLLYDYGAYTGSWDGVGGIEATDVRRARVRIGGEVAELVAYRARGRYFVRAWWGNVDRMGPLDVHLLVEGVADTEEGRRELLAVIHSVRFE